MMKVVWTTDRDGRSSKALQTLFLCSAWCAWAAWSADLSAVLHDCLNAARPIAMHDTHSQDTVNIAYVSRR